VCVDTEHGNIDGILLHYQFYRKLSKYFADGAMHEAVVAIAKEGISPIVRIAANESWMIKRALDAGAHGIVVPLIYTVDDAKRVVSAAKFSDLLPPKCKFNTHHHGAN
jgi:4-hydroxy-2-oxoheptanedioate aldolase